MKYIGIVLMVFGGGSFFWANPRLEHAQEVMRFTGNDQFSQSITGITPMTVLFYDIACYGGLIAAIVGAILLVLGAMKQRQPGSSLA